jgi:glycosyltransferase involved in cell wall biosynthesis
MSQSHDFPALSCQGDRGTKPKVSVIIPTYGHTEFLPGAIDSVFAQTFDDFELLIVDDNDPSSRYRRETEAIVKRHQAMGRGIIYLQHDRNRNGAAARNTGLRRSSGEFVSFLDSDDRYVPTRLEVAVDILKHAADDVGGVYTGVEFRRNGRRYGAFEDVGSGNFLVETLACTFKLGTGSNLFMRRSVMEHLRGFDEAFWRHQDYEFMVRFFQAFDIAGTNEILVIKNNENVNLPNFKKSHQIKEQFLTKYRSVVDSMPAADKALILRQNYVWLGEQALKEALRQESRAMYAIANASGRMGLRDRARRAVLWTASWLR